MKKPTIFLIVMLWIGSSLQAQSSFPSTLRETLDEQYPTVEEVVAAGKDLEYAFRRFEEVAKKIKFDIGDTTVANRMKEMIRQTIETNRSANRRISSLVEFMPKSKQQRPVAGVGLSMLNAFAEGMVTAHLAMGFALTLNERHPILAGEIQEVSKTAATASVKLYQVLVKQLTVEAVELGAYRKFAGDN